MNSQFDLNVIIECLPPILSRHMAEVHTGGLVNARTLANHDSLGIGPKVRLKIGRKVGYTRESLVEYLQSRLEGAHG